MKAIAQDPPVERPRVARLHRRRGLFLLAGPALLVASEIAEPSSPPGASARAEAAFLLAHQGRVLLAALLGLVAAALLVGGFVTASAVVRRPMHRNAVPRAARVLGVIGALGLSGHMVLTLAARDVLLADAADWRAVDAYAMGLSGAVTILALVVGMNLAVLLLAVSARNTRLAGWWIVVVAVLALVADLSGTTWGTTAFATLAAVVLGVHARASTATTDISVGQN